MLSFWKRLGLVATLLSFVAFSSVEAQKEDMAELPKELDSSSRSLLKPVLSRAADRGLPVQALIDKAAEGILRGVSSERIVKAVIALEERLTTAHVALAPSSHADILAGADALAVGVHPNTLRAMRRQIPKAPIMIPLAVLTQLVAQGVEQSRATDIVFELLKRGVTHQQLLALRESVNSDIIAGKSAASAIDDRVAVILTALGREGSPGYSVSGAISSDVVGSQAFSSKSKKGAKAGSRK